jgi:hypothetical protein
VRDQKEFCKLFYFKQKEKELDSLDGIEREILKDKKEYDDELMIFLNKSKDR